MRNYLGNTEIASRRSRQGNQVPPKRQQSIQLIRRNLPCIATADTLRGAENHRVRKRIIEPTELMSQARSSSTYIVRNQYNREIR